MPDADEVETPISATEETPQAVEPVDDGQESPPHSDTFPRVYVEKLRKENATYRDRAKEAEKQRGVVEAKLHFALVQDTGLLADPHDLPFDPAHLDDPEALLTAIEELIAAKPHLRSRKPSGDVGQGVKGQPAQPSLLAMLKSVV
jgi:hypothetical protein